jgi:hypothetical protein
VQAGEKWDASIQTTLLNAVVQSKPDAILIAAVYFDQRRRKASERM